MKNKQYILLILCLSTFHTLLGQGISNLWLMGYDCCSPPFASMNLNFATGSLVIDTVHRNMDFSETNGEICDRNGNLLFYSNGNYVANALDDTMQNGSGLNPSPYTTNQGPYGLTLPQANFIIPFPDDSSKYFLFHETCDDCGFSYSSFHLYYSVIDMSLDNGLGAVTQKNQIALNDSLIVGRITGCKHANGRDWWLIVPHFMNGYFHEFLITPQGIQGPWQKNLVTHRDIYAGQNLFSPQGDKFAYYDPYGDLDIWNFNRCTGDFANQVHIDINDTAYGGGCAFSPSGKYLYLSSDNYVYQYDIQSSNIDSTKIIVGVYDGFTSFGLAANFYLSALAPDGKIYINCGNSTTVLHKIDYPDSAGLACGFCQHCVVLPGANAFTMPNHPNYFLGAEGNSVCDSLPTDISTIKKPVEEFSLFPNPARTDLYLNITKHRAVAAKICNSFSQFIESTSELIKDEYIRFDVSKLKSGIYYIEIISDEGKQVKLFVKE